MAASLEEKKLAGRQAFQFFYNASLKFAGPMSAFGSYSAFEAYMDSLGTPVFASGSVRANLGSGILAASGTYSMSRVKTQMEKVATAYAGAVPDYRGASKFLDALATDSISVSRRVELVGQGFVEGVKDAAKTVATVVTGGAMLYLLGAGIALYVVFKGRAAAA